MTSSKVERRCFRWWPLAIAMLLVAYVLSSGPILAGGCWLREQTRWDGWYVVFWLYYPLLAVFGPDSALVNYIEWWFDLFGTVGPG